MGFLVLNNEFTERGIGSLCEFFSNGWVTIAMEGSMAERMKLKRVRE